MLSMNIRLRPSMSPKCAITMPPSGRARYPAAKMPKVCSWRSQSGISGGKNELPDHNSEKHEDDEIVELQCAAQSGQHQRSVFTATSA